jgi:lysophospholipase L1-like esterase
MKNRFHILKKLSGTSAVVMVISSLFMGLSAFVAISDWPPAEESFSGYDPLTLPLPNYPFVNQQANRLLYPVGQNDVLNPVFETLDSILFADTGKLSIVHLGGSHVQAGTLGNRMREHFQNLGYNLDAERGLVFPYSLAHTNGQANVKVKYTGDWEGGRCAHNNQHCDWGMTGYNVLTDKDSAQVKLWSIRSDSTTYKFDKVTFLHALGGNAMHAELIGIATDSIYSDTAMQATVFMLSEAIDTLRFQVVGGDNYDLRGILLENSNAAITYHEIGVNGASTKSYLRSKRMEAELKLLSPDLVIFGIGINDAYMTEDRFDPDLFETRYDSLIQRFQSANPNVRFLFLTNNDSYYRKRYPNKNALRVQTSMYRLSEKHGAAVWDLFEVMGGLNSIQAWEKAGLAKKDKIHFTSAGYTFQADLLFEAFRSAYGDHLSTIDPLQKTKTAP